ncbi:MAG: rhodanese-like domain-containing protein [Bacteriovoracaceae bacterium]
MSNTHMTLMEFYKTHNKLNPGEVILDVRRPDEFAEGHIPGAINIPVDQVSGQLDKLKSFKSIYIHCKRGGRAKTAFDLLSGAGLSNLICVHDAGMDAWIENGFPVER